MPKGPTMRKPSKIALRSLIAAVILFAAALPFGNNGWEKTAGGTLFVLSVAAAAVFVISGVYSLATSVPGPGSSASLSASSCWRRSLRPDHRAAHLGRADGNPSRSGAMEPGPGAASIAFPDNPG
jgi:hypothetical protein